MVVSAIRTVLWRPPMRGISRVPAWPVAQPDDMLDYSIDLTAWLADAADVISSAAWSAQPSGSGELEIGDLGVVGAVVTGWLSGGVAGRVYLVRNEITTANGRTLETFVSLAIDRQLESLPLSAPPSSGFGTPVVATATLPAMLSLGPITALSDGLVGAGSSQTTACLLPSLVNIITSAPVGTAFILRSDVLAGTFIAQNDDPTDGAPIYPPVGAQINNLGVNNPFVVGSGGARISFSTKAPTTQWYAG